MSRRRLGPSGFALALAAMLLPAAASAAPAFTTTRLSLRSGPATEYPPVALLEPGVQVEVLGCLEGYGWCDAMVGRDRGWLPGNYLQAPYYERREPLIGIAPAIGLPIIGFAAGNYWDNYYRGRPFYRERDRWVGYAPPPPRWRHDGPPGPGPGWRGPDRDWRGGPDRDWRGGPGRDGRGPPGHGPGGPGFGHRDGGPPGHGGQWGGGPGRPDGPRQASDGRGPGGPPGGGPGGGGPGGPGGGPRGDRGDRGGGGGPPGDRGPR